ncbi:hypothetical protein ASG40_04500 [Methylobacterium sp. Leaf399]|uniref:DUF3489 domain-containing protein n=1 Tax=unclassified Methylobacterium TaxID=2615210 RepID=UPI0006F1DAC0|nr:MULTISPECIES: DUF3489 domain-containing protein [unclassified Methylobacterium]KQP56333.1 hypothetical protein ASF39_19140 [Methylobacterium sp. Leaf108]KQT14592.1 hypothetical protein ASG40_04500 [Methylobacterium sp. Leaf399]
MTIDEPHHALLQAAAQTRNQLIVRPAGLNSRAAKLLFARLCKTASAAEVVVCEDEPYWHNDERGRIGLRLPPTSRKRLGLDGDGDGSDASKLVADAGLGQGGIAPRSGTKRALIVAMLRRDQGATLVELMAATGWLAHSTRAALTGLRKRELPLTKARDADDRTVYRLIDDVTAKAR